MKLKTFCKKFIHNNTVIRIYDADQTALNKEVADRRGESSYEAHLLWKGMEWQITDTNSNYFKIHTDVLPCFFVNSEVVGVFSEYDDVYLPVLSIEVSVNWKDYYKQKQAYKKWVRKFTNQGAYNEIL